MRRSLFDYSAGPAWFEVIGAAITMLVVTAISPLAIVLLAIIGLGRGIRHLYRGASKP